MAEPNIPQKFPYVTDIEAGKYAWCACGYSLNQPYCDGSHKNTGMSPKIVEIKEHTTAVWCGCKHTKNPPFCDGTHSSL